MTDKVRSVFPIRISFAEGEQPSPAKVTAIASQAKAGFAIIEKAVGDIWGQSGDPLLQDYPLQIVNLARVQGEQWRNNSLFPTPDFTGSDIIVVQQIVSSQQGKPELLLDFAPDTGTTTNLVASLAVFGYTVAVGARTGLNASNKYFVDSTNHKILLGAPLSTASTLFSYEVDQNEFPAPSDLYQEDGMNVIPDPRTVSDGWEGLKFYKVSSNKYLMFLPPRCPTSVAVGKAPQNIAGNRATDATTLKYFFPLGAAFAALSAGIRTSLSTMQQYRYKFPVEISSLVNDAGETGTRIPAGLIYLWDNDSDSIIEGITFRVPETNPAYSSSVTPRPRWAIQIEGPHLDALLDGGTTYHETLITSDLVGHYKSRFSIITVGNSTAKALSTTMYDVLSHNHSAGLATRVSHGDLLNLDPGLTTAVMTGRAPLGAPYTAGDDHAQYLSRLGSTGTTANQRDRYNNGMLGDLLISSTTSSNNYQNTAASSNKIWFGALTSGVAIWGSGTELQISPNLEVANNANVVGFLEVGADLTVGGPAILGDSLTVVSNMSVSGVSTLRGIVNTLNDVNAGGTITTPGAVVADTVSSVVTTASTEFIGPNAAFAWGHITTNGTGGINAGATNLFGCTAALNTGNVCEVSFSARGSQYYACVVTPGFQGVIGSPHFALVDNKTTTGFRVRLKDETLATVPIQSEVRHFDFICFGV